MEKAINNKDIILVDEIADFDTLPDFNPDDYGEAILSYVPFKKYLRVKKAFDLKSLISHLFE